MKSQWMEVKEISLECEFPHFLEKVFYMHVKLYYNIFIFF